jgi:hypothetical protein
MTKGDARRTSDGTVNGSKTDAAIKVAGAKVDVMVEVAVGATDAAHISGSNASRRSWAVKGT